MALNYLLCKAEVKDLHVQFGATCTTYKNCVHLGMKVVVSELINHPQAKVFWDRLPEGLARAASKTCDFLDIPNVIEMIDGDKIGSK